MVASSARESIANARTRIRNNTTNGSGMCLRDVRGHLEIDSCFMTAEEARQDIAGSRDFTHYDGNPNHIPPGAPVWSHGSNPAGHIFLSMRISPKSKRRLFATNDVHGDGRIDYVDISFFSQQWGHTVQGWGRELNRTQIPYLDGSLGRAAAGRQRVRLSALRPEKHNPDVRILERKLHAQGFPLGESRLKVDGVFGDQTRTAVRQYQKRVMDASDKAADGIPGKGMLEKLGLVVVD
jgi:Putative peptidoglycan binding domain